eukprot:SAG11_NODE_16588_length_543_cov_1.376126_1_plen_21_part_10
MLILRAVSAPLVTLPALNIPC